MYFIIYSETGPHSSLHMGTKQRHFHVINLLTINSHQISNTSQFIFIDKSSYKLHILLTTIWGAVKARICILENILTKTITCDTGIANSTATTLFNLILHFSFTRLFKCHVVCVFKLAKQFANLIRPIDTFTICLRQRIKWRSVQFSFHVPTRITYIYALRRAYVDRTASKSYVRILSCLLRLLTHCHWGP
jgi:hypothetical protein